MTDPKPATPATDEQVKAWIELGADGRLFIPAHVIDSLVARISADAETIKAKDEEIERLRKVRTGSAVERLHNLCDGFEESDKAQEAELTTLRAQVETLREALTGVLPGVDDAWALWPDGRDAVLKARAAIAATEPKG